MVLDTTYIGSDGTTTSLEKLPEVDGLFVRIEITNGQSSYIGYETVQLTNKLYITTVASI